MATKLYVGGLPYSTQEDALRELFSKAGNVTSAAVIMDRMSGRSKGFGFVEMSTDEEAQATADTAEVIAADEESTKNILETPPTYVGVVCVYTPFFVIVFLVIIFISERSSVVESCPDKTEVEGPIPSARTHD